MCLTTKCHLVLHKVYASTRNSHILVIFGGINGGFPRTQTISKTDDMFFNLIKPNNFFYCYVKKYYFSKSLKFLLKSVHCYFLQALSGWFIRCVRM